VLPILLVELLQGRCVAPGRVALSSSNEIRKLGVVAAVPLCCSLWGAGVVVHCDLWLRFVW
jgi:hypothetical protein